MVSVIVPTYNRFGLLQEAISSVLSQTLVELELIVVDDGSTDGTSDYLRTLTDARVHSIELAHTGNIARVRNAGASEASGQHLCFLDSDDRWRPNKLETQLDRMSSMRVRWSYTNFELVDEMAAPVPMRAGTWKALSGDIAEPLIATDAAVALCTVMVERNLFADLGGFDEDPRLILREDFEFLVRLAIAATTVAVPDVLAQVRDHSGRETQASEGAAPFVGTAYTYTRLLATLEVPRHRRAAHRRRAYHFARAAAESLKHGSAATAAVYAVRACVDRLALR